jgi:hypothetical protein
MCVFLLLITPGLYSQIRFPEPETNIEWYYISGPLAPQEKGDDDHRQTFYLSLPSAFDDPFSISLVHPSSVQKAELLEGQPDSKFSFSVYGGTGLYTPAENPLYQPGNLLYYQEFSTFDSLVSSHPISPFHGELTLNIENRFFRIEIQGIEGNDGHLYALEVHSENPESLTNSQVKLMSNNISFMLPENPNAIGHIFINVPPNGMGISIWNFDWDEDGQIRIISPVRSGQFIFASGDGVSKITLLKLFKEEQGDTLNLQIIRKKSKPILYNFACLRWIIEDADGNNISLPLPVKLSGMEPAKPIKLN